MAMTDDRRQLHLVLRAQSGDRAAQDELLRGVQAPLFAYLRGLCGDRHLAEDVLQEVFVICVRKLGWLREARLFRPWLYRIASREAFRALKRRRRAGQRTAPEDLARQVPAPVEEPPGLEPEERAALHAHVEHVSPASRAVLLLHYLQGLSLEEVAQVLGLALGTVKSRLAYGLATLRETLDAPQRARTNR